MLFASTSRSCCSAEKNEPSSMDDDEDTSYPSWQDWLLILGSSITTMICLFSGMRRPLNCDNANINNQRMQPSIRVRQHTVRPYRFDGSAGSIRMRLCTYLDPSTSALVPTFDSKGCATKGITKAFVFGVHFKAARSLTPYIESAPSLPQLQFRRKIAFARDLASRSDGRHLFRSLM